MYLFIFVFFFFNKAGKTKAAREFTAINQNMLVLSPVFTENKAKWMLSASSSFRTTAVSKVHSQKQYRDASVFVLHSFLLPLVFSAASLPSTPVELARSKTRKLECPRPTYCVPLPVCVCVCNNERYEKTMRYGVEDTGTYCYQTFSENVKNQRLP